MKSLTESNACLSVLYIEKAMDNNIQKILREATNVAVIGCSIEPSKDAHKVPAFLQKRGYQIIPVNPNHDEILGETCYHDLKSIPDNLPVDIVEIFRPSNETAGIVRRIIEWANKNGRKPVIWTQLGVSSEEAEQLARVADFTYVKNRCMKIEYRQMESELQS